MSFFNCANQEGCNCQSQVANTSGACEKICVELKRVFDACKKQTTLENIPVCLTDMVPACPVKPLKFCGINPKGDCVLENINILPIKEKPCHARVQADVVIEIIICYLDANGVPGRGTGIIVVPIDLVLCLPKPSIAPYEIKAICGMVSTAGTYICENKFKISICLTLIIKVLMDVELIIPSYGYCNVPFCQDYSEEVCADFFELPLYPNLS